MKEKTGDIKTAYEMDYSDAQSVQAHYAGWADEYDADTGRYGYVGPSGAAAILAKYLANKAAVVLDIGCGTGLVGEALSGLGLDHIDGTDLSAEMIEKCRAKGIYRALQCDDLLKGLDVPTGRYDAVISVGTFGPIGPEALPNALAPLSAGGLACISINEIFLEKHDFERAFADLVSAGDWQNVWSGLVPHLVEGGHQALVTLLRKL